MGKGHKEIIEVLKTSQSEVRTQVHMYMYTSTLLLNDSSELIVCTTSDVSSVFKMKKPIKCLFNYFPCNIGTLQAAYKDVEFSYSVSIITCMYVRETVVVMEIRKQTLI